MVIARYGEMSLAQARRRARDLLQRIARETTPPTTSFGKTDPDGEGAGRRIPAPVRSVLEAIGTQDRAHLSQGPHPAGLRAHAFGPVGPGGRGRMVRCREPGQARRGQPRVRDPALDDEPGRGMGFAGARHESLPRHQEKPQAHIARFLDRDELARLGKALDAHQARSPEAVAAIRLLALHRLPPR